VTPGAPTLPEACQLRVCIDVEELEAAIHFYRQALGLRLGRRRGEEWAELLGASSPIDLLAKPPGSTAAPGAEGRRDYRRHWTPVHLDFVVADVDAAVARALASGARLDRAVQVQEWGRMANLADPFGNGFCLLEFRDAGYDAALATASP
jgi:predicted enzyme related to lactoylglutathione lyase